MFKYALALIALVFATAFAEAAPEKFVKTIYISSSGSASNKGLSAASPKPFSDGDLWAIPAGTCIEKVFVSVDTVITGTTNFDVGDDDDADGFIDGSLSVTLGTAGVYGYNAKTGGAYLRVETAGATDPADIDVVPTQKCYSATGKEVKLDVTGTNTAGAAKVVIVGYSGM